MQHPERDMEDFTRVIDQYDPSINMKGLESFTRRKKRLFSETQQEINVSDEKLESPDTAHIKPPPNKKQISINNTVEVYFYPQE